MGAVCVLVVVTLAGEWHHHGWSGLVRTVAAGVLCLVALLAIVEWIERGKP